MVVTDAFLFAINYNYNSPLSLISVFARHLASVNMQYHNCDFMITQHRGQEPDLHRYQEPQNAEIQVNINAPGRQQKKTIPLSNLHDSSLSLPYYIKENTFQPW